MQPDLGPLLDFVENFMKSIVEVRESGKEQTGVYSHPDGDVEVIVRRRSEQKLGAIKIVVDDSLPEGHWELRP